MRVCDKKLLSKLSKIGENRYRKSLPSGWVGIFEYSGAQNWTVYVTSPKEERGQTIEVGSLAIALQHLTLRAALQKP